MRPRLAAVYILLVLLPLGILGWLGLKLAQEEHVNKQNDLQQLMQQGLTRLDDTIARVIENLENELLRATDFIPANSENQVSPLQQSRIIQPTYDTPQLRRLARKNRFVRQFFVISRDNQFLHPPTTGDHQTFQEKRFYERTLSVWESGHDLHESRKDSREEHKSHGWHTWFWGDGVNLIFWRRTPAGHLLGAEIEVVALQAEIIAQLPANSKNQEQPERIQLIDTSEDVLYQWGFYEPREGETAQTSIPVAEPFTMWKLRYFSPLASHENEFLPSKPSASLIILGAIVVLLALYFYKENTRDLRIASQRVTFVNQVSHELKTPLTNIRMYADLLESKIPEEESQSRNYLKVITNESRRLTRLISNVLTFAQSQRQEIRLHKTANIPDQVIRETIAHFRPALENRNFQIKLDLNAEQEVQIDGDILEQILGNIFGNVEKYAAEGQFLAVSSRQQEGRLEITIADHGPGIPVNQRETIFKPFHRISNQLSDGVSGTGIGLSIVRELACLHGGDISLLPTEKGATFQLTLST